MEGLGILELLTLILGSNGLVALIVSFATIKYEKRKSKSEAKGAEAEADMKRQDYYQEVISDLQADRVRMKEVKEEQEKYIDELREDRKRLRDEKEELRKENDDLRKLINELQDVQREQGDKIARLGRMYKVMTPLICTNTGCKMRQGDIMGLVSDDSFETNKEEEKEQ